MKNNKQKFTKDYDGTDIKMGKVMAPFDYVDLEAENYTNPECIKTFMLGGRTFKVVLKAVDAKAAEVVKGEFNYYQNETLGHYSESRVVSLEAMMENTGEEIASVMSPEDICIEEESRTETDRYFRGKMSHILEKSSKVGYAILLIYKGYRGKAFEEKMLLKHDAANNVRQVADSILKQGLEYTDIDGIRCNKSKHTDYYREEAEKLVDEILAEL